MLLIVILGSVALSLHGTTYRLWGPSGVLVTPQGSFNLVRMRGSNGLFLGPMCIGPEKGSNPYIILFYSNTGLHVPVLNNDNAVKSNEGTFVISALRVWCE